MKDIKPCPFCGSNEIIIFDEAMQSSEGFMFYAFCLTCAAQGPKAMLRETAPTAWNNQNQSSLLREAKTALESVLQDSEHYGHSGYCNAIRGPANEHWYKHDMCDCHRIKVIEFLSRMEGVK